MAVVPPASATPTPSRRWPASLPEPWRASCRTAMCSTSRAVGGPWSTRSANLGWPGLSATAIAAVDVALWDLKAKLLGLSVADPLGRAHPAVPVYGSGGLTSYSEAEVCRQL